MQENQGVKKLSPWSYTGNTYLYGDNMNGAGIYQNHNGQWFANIVHPYISSIQGAGPFATKKHAQSYCETELASLDEELEAKYLKEMGDY